MDKVYNLCRVKTDISAVLTVRSGLDPHMIIKLEEDSKSTILLMVIVLFTFIYLLWVSGINLYLVNACLIKLDQLKMLIAVKPCRLFLVLTLHVS